MIGRLLPAAIAVAAFCAAPALAQTAVSTGGNVGSAALRNGYPAGAGAAVALPSVVSAGASPTGTNAATAGTTVTGTTVSGTTVSGTTVTAGGAASAVGGGAGGGRGGAGRGSSGGSTAGAAAPTASANGANGGGDWIVCPPSGSPGLAPLLTGTDLACAPQ